MNLIEQLGGYGECERLRKAPAASSFRIRGIEFTRNELDQAMLEYRREHNIFEAGDRVIVLTNALGNKYTWALESIDGCMVEISQIGQLNEWVHFSEITHAIDDEIIRGLRLCNH